MSDNGWVRYRKTATQEMRPYVPGEDLTGVSVAPGETPKEGGMIARDAQGSRRYVSPEFMAENYERVVELTGEQKRLSDAVDKFAFAMKKRLEQKRAIGWFGWERNPEEYAGQRQLMKNAHDAAFNSDNTAMVDTANYAMMLWVYKRRIVLRHQDILGARQDRT